jgi:hypothetical protein
VGTSDKIVINNPKFSQQFDSNQVYGLEPRENIAKKENSSKEFILNPKQQKQIKRIMKQRSNQTLDNQFVNYGIETLEQPKRLTSQSVDYLEKLSYSNKKQYQSLSSKSSSKASKRSSSSKKKKSTAKSSSPSVKATVFVLGKKRDSMFSFE